MAFCQPGMFLLFPTSACSLNGQDENNILFLSVQADIRARLQRERLWRQARRPGRARARGQVLVGPEPGVPSGVKGSKANLADAKAICLMECPTPAPDGLNFVCDYPEGDVRLSVDDWINRDYNYFDVLTPDMRNSSLQLQGPCYPVIFPSVNGKPVIKHRVKVQLELVN